MFRITLIFLLLNLMNVGNISAQNLDLTGRGFGARLRSQSITPNQGRLNNNQLLNLRTSRFSDSKSSISKDGKVIVIDNQLIKNEGSQFKKVEIPLFEDSILNPILSNNGEVYLLSTFDNQTSQYRLHFFNTNNELVEKELSLPPLRNLHINHNASSLLYEISSTTQLSYHVTEISQNTNETSQVIEFTLTSNLTGPSIRFFSNLGDRIIITATLRDAREFRYFMIDKLETGWSEPIEWKVMDAEGNELDFDIVDIANNGRTLLLTNANDGLALTHEIDGNWTPPKPIGYKSHGNRSLISENGKVIAVQEVKRNIPNEITFYDVFVFLQNPADQWIQRQVNDPQLEVFDGIMLSDDGTQLLWLPANTSSVPGAEEYR